MALPLSRVGCRGCTCAHATLKLAQIGGAALWLHPKFVGLCGITSRMDLHEEQRQGRANRKGDRMIPWTGRRFMIAGFCEYEQGLWRRTTEPTLYLPDRWCA
jgi:hypothetical protein